MVWIPQTVLFAAIITATLLSKLLLNDFLNFKSLATGLTSAKDKTGKP